MKRFADGYRFGTFEVNGAVFPRVMMGTSPFTGAGYFLDKAYAYQQQFLQQPQNMTRLMVEAIQNGCNAFQILAHPPILQALEMAIERTATEVFLCATVGFTDVRTELDELKLFTPQSILTDAAFTDKNLIGIGRFLSAIREKAPKALIGISTNTPGTVLDRAAEIDAIQVIMTPVNRNGSFMRPSQEEAMTGMNRARKMGKTLIGMQVLAAGELRPEEAFPYVKDKVDAIAVGLTSTIEITETLRSARKAFC